MRAVGEDAGPHEWAGRFEAQAAACDDLGSTLYARLLRILAGDCAAGGRTWELVRPHAGLRFGQAGPLRLVGAAHRLALAGIAADWAALLPSCGGTVPQDDGVLAAGWAALADRHAVELSDGLTREVQTNEVGRAAGLALALAVAGPPDGIRLVEPGCSGGLNLRLDHFSSDLGGEVLGVRGSPVRLAPELRSPLPAGLGRLPTVAERIGLDPHSVDVTTDDGAWTLLSFVWPDQSERVGRVRAAIDLARDVPADLRRVADTGVALAGILDGPGVPTVVQHSIVWQYLPIAQRWAVTDALEEAGRRATAAAPLVWVRYEPDEWNRTRAALWVRTWPGGADRLVAHVDFHGRWLAPVPAP